MIIYGFIQDVTYSNLVNISTLHLTWLDVFKCYKETSRMRNYVKKLFMKIYAYFVLYPGSAESEA